MEYSYAKISSVLKIGPHISNHLGYDLLVFDSFVEFSMEVC